MTGWDGTGLPPVAAERVRRAAGSGLRTSLLSAPAAAGIKTVGLEPVGEVMGCAVMSLGMGISRSLMASAKPFQHGLRYGYNTALSRLTTEARAIGADGVIGITVDVKPIGDSTQEFLVMGTAVRLRTEERPTHLFSTELSGSDVTKLLHAGWAPVDTVVAVAVQVAYMGYGTQQQLSVFAGNIEVDVHTRLVNSVRADARAELQAAVTRGHADGAIVSDMSLNTWALENMGIAGLATIQGTTITRFHEGRPAPTSALTIMPLNSTRGSR